MTSHRLARFSQYMATLTLSFIVAMLLLNAACWFYPGLNSIKGGYGAGFGLTDRLISTLSVDIAAFPGWQRLGSIILSSVPLLALAYGLCHLRTLFQSYARGDYFSNASAMHLGKLGQAVVIWVMLNFVCEPLLGVWLTLREPAGHHIVTLTFVAADVVALFLAACILVIAYILRQASNMATENKQFV